MNNNKRRLIADPDAFDARGILKDGRTARVPTRLRDGQSLPYDVRKTLTDAERTALRGCQPGYRFAADSQSMRERRQWAADAYTSHEYELTNAWRDGNGGRRFGSAGQPGDQCTINGAPGHLERRNGQLQCVPDGEDDDDQVFDDSEALDAREAAYQDYVRWLRNAWRKT